jgi:hypothetical protein
LEILQVLVVGPDLHRVPSTFQVMPPLLLASDDSQHLGVMDLIISLHWVQHLGQEGDRVPRIVVDILLGEDRTSSNAGYIGL